LLNLPDFVVFEIGIEWNRKRRSVRFVTIGETGLIQIAMERSKDGLATMNPLLFYLVDQINQTIRIRPEMRQPDHKPIISMHPTWGHARTDSGLGGQGFPIGCRKEPAAVMKGREPS
jgi:hypothetical protein